MCHLNMPDSFSSRCQNPFCSFNKSLKKFLGIALYLDPKVSRVYTGPRHILYPSFVEIRSLVLVLSCSQTNHARPEIRFSQQTVRHNYDGRLMGKQNKTKQNIFLVLLRSPSICALDCIPREEEGRRVPPLACVSPHYPASRCVSTRGLTINRAPSLFNLLAVWSRQRQSQRINNSITEGFCIQEKSKEIQSKQINVPARMKNFWAA